VLTAEQNRMITQVSAGTPMGELLRRYWIPFAGASEFDDKPVRAVRLLGEDLVAYRAGNGTFGLLNRHCPHRRADLSYGFVEDCGLRCNYHGWMLDEAGHVIEMPYDDTANPNQNLKAKASTKAYPVKEVAGLLFTYMGPAPVPELPVWAPFTWTGGFRQIVKSDIPCNWFQCQENSCDPVHFEWMHDNWGARLEGRNDIATKHLQLDFVETDFGHAYRRIREGQEEGSTLWTVGRLALWPLAFYLGEHFEWRVPIDDENTLSLAWFFEGPPKDVAPVVQAKVPVWISPIVDSDGRWITTHVINQDIVAWVGQGRIADRSQEFLAASDRGIVMMRRRYFEDMKRVEQGLDPKGVIRDAEVARCVPLGRVLLPPLPGDLTREQWKKHPGLKRKLIDHRHCAGQPQKVRQDYLRAMGFGPDLSLLPNAGRKLETQDS
jgi:5,5'-dehydrodivanillate O-demethylase